MDFLRSYWNGSTPQQLQTVLTSFRGEFSRELNVRFQALYQRICKRANIATQHPLWAKELSVLDTRMAAAWKTAEHLYHKIPALESHQDKISALSSMLQIERLAFRLTEKSRRLQAILNSPYHQKALKYYKDSVKECEVGVEEERMTTLLSAEPALGEEDPLVKREIDLLYDEVRKFAVYTRGGPHATIQMPCKHECKETLYEVALPDENHFRGHIWFQQRRYPAIFTECLALHQAAKGLYSLEQRFAKRLELVATTDMNSELFLQQHAEDVEALDELEKAIETVHFQLTQLPRSNEIHAGWYYVAGLMAQARWLQEDLTEAAGGEFLAYAGALSVLRGQPDVQQVAGVQLPASSDCYSRVHAVMVQIFEKEFETTVQLVGSERSFAKEVFTRTLHWHAHEEELQSYITKGLLKPTREFEAVLYRMQHDPLYRADFQRILDNSQQLQDFVQKPSTDLKQITDVLVSLYEPCSFAADSREALFDRYVRLHKAFRVYRSCQDPWFRTQLEAFSQEWKEADEIHKSNKGEMLYQYLWVSLFSLDVDKQKAADAEIVKALTLEHCSQPGIIKVLAFRWVLERHIGKTIVEDFALLSLNARGKVEKDLLNQLLTWYVTKPTWTKFWRSQYDTGFMELALQKFINENNIKFKARLEAWPFLDKVLIHYAQFRKIIDQHGPLKPDTKAYAAARDIYNKAQALIVNPVHESQKIATALCTEMHEFLYLGRISYTKT